MSAYKELRERCARELFLDEHPDQSWTRISDFRKTDYRGHAQAVLAEVYRTLETVTDEMTMASYKYESVTFGPTSCGLKHSVIFDKMLRASPLAPPKDKP